MHTRNVCGTPKSKRNIGDIPHFGNRGRQWTCLNKKYNY